MICLRYGLSVVCLNAIGDCSGYTSALGCRWEFLLVHDRLTVLLVAHRGILTGSRVNLTHNGCVNTA